MELKWEGPMVWASQGFCKDWMRIVVHFPFPTCPFARSTFATWAISLFLIRTHIQITGNFLVVQWLGLDAFTAMGLASVPGLKTKISLVSWHGWEKTQQFNHRKQEEICMNLIHFCFF